jgi:hypothetical protein
MKTLNTISDEIIRSLSSLISCLIIVNVIFLMPQRKKLFGDKSGNRGGQAVGPNLPIESSLEREKMYILKIISTYPRILKNIRQFRLC